MNAASVLPTMFDAWGSRLKTLLAAVPVAAIVAYFFVSRRRALCAGREPEVGQAQAERANSSVSEAPVEEGQERRREGFKAPKKCEEEKLQLSRQQLHWSYSAGGAPVLLGPGGMVEHQRKVMSPNEKREMDLMLKYQGRGSRTVSGSFEAAKAKKARQTQRKSAKVEETPEVDASFQKMANELSVVELEAMILKPDGKAKKAKKPKGRKKKAFLAEDPEVVEIPELVKVEVTEMATEESEDVPVEVPLEEPAVEVVEATNEGDAKSTEETATASPVAPEPNVSEEPMLQVRSRRGLRKRRRKALLEAEAKKAELAVGEKAAAGKAAAVEAAMVDADDAKFKEMVEDAQEDTTLAEDEPSEDTRDAADDASSSDAKEPKSTEEEVKEEKIIDSPKDFTVKCSGSTGTEGTWHRTELTTTRKKWADLVDSDDEPS